MLPLLLSSGSVACSLPTISSFVQSLSETCYILVHAQIPRYFLLLSSGSVASCLFFYCFMPYIVSRDPRIDSRDDLGRFYPLFFSPVISIQSTLYYYPMNKYFITKI